MRRITVLLLAVLWLQIALPALAAPADEFSVEAFPHTGDEIEFTNDWGNPRAGGRSHQGTDIFSPKGTPVVAIADGFVEYVEHWPTAGYALIIRHAGGWSSHYYHLNNDTPGTDDGAGGWDGAFAPGIEEGVFVFEGQVVAYVGDSGNAEPSSAHTHFELHHDGRAVNPYPYLAEAWQRHLLLQASVELGLAID